MGVADPALPPTDPCLGGDWVCVRWAANGDCRKWECVRGGTTPGDPDGGGGSTDDGDGGGLIPASLPGAPVPWPATPVADFDYEVFAGRQVRFRDTSLNPGSIAKSDYTIRDNPTGELGNRNQIISTKNPLVTMRGTASAVEVIYQIYYAAIGYEHTGPYSGTWIVKTVSMLVNGNPVGEATVGFNYTTKGKVVYFLNTSTKYATSWLWTFKNTSGVVEGYSIEKNPAWLFADYGDHEVILTQGGMTYAGTVTIEEGGESEIALAGASGTQFFLTDDSNMRHAFNDDVDYTTNIETSSDGGINFTPVDTGLSITGYIRRDIVTGYLYYHTQEAEGDDMRHMFYKSTNNGTSWTAVGSGWLESIDPVTGETVSFFSYRVHNNIIYFLAQYYESDVDGAPDVRYYQSSNGTDFTYHAVTGVSFLELIDQGGYPDSRWNISGNIHAFVSGADPNYYLTFTIDGGVNWTNIVVPLPSDAKIYVQGTYMYLLYFDSTNGKLYIKSSSNSGSSWGSAVEVASWTVMSPYQQDGAQGLVLCELGIDPSDDTRIMLIYQIQTLVDADAYVTYDRMETFYLDLSENVGVTFANKDTFNYHVYYPTPEGGQPSVRNFTDIPQISSTGIVYIPGAPNGVHVYDLSYTPGMDEVLDSDFITHIDPNDSKTVTFTDTSMGTPTVWLWEFGDGSTSTNQNPNHTYAATGLYSVRLTVSYEDGTSDVFTYTVTIIDSEPIIYIPPPIASFTVAAQTGAAPLTVQFTDISQGDSISWAWNFGDGSSSSTQNPTHIFTSGGTYTVTLITTGQGGYTSQSLIQVVVATATDLPIAEFSVDKAYGRSPLTIQFTDASEGTVTSRLWSFGDGTTSTETSPSHIFRGSGIRTVRLTCTNSSGSTYAEMQIVLITTPMFLRGTHGFYYILDTGKNIIWVYTLAGSFVKIIGGTGATVGKFNTPTSMKIIGANADLERSIINVQPAG